MFCNFSCIHCWRTFEKERFKSEGLWDDPKFILDQAIESHKKLLTGFGGNPKTSKKMFQEASNPKHVAISLDGEPTLYPKIADFVKEIKSRGMTAFLVTNSTMPTRLRQLLKEEPTNLYLSIYGPDAKIYNEVARPFIKDAWKKVNESLGIMKKFKKCRTVLRITCVKGLNMENPTGYAKLIKKSNPKFVELKGYSWVGESRQRLKEENVPSIKEMKEFAEHISELTNYPIRLADSRSRVVLLALPEIINPLKA